MRPWVAFVLGAGAVFVWQHFTGGTGVGAPRR
jgi:hypothetical protein